MSFVLVLAASACAIDPGEGKKGGATKPPPDAGQAGPVCPDDAGDNIGPRGDFAAAMSGDGRHLVVFGGDTGVPQNCLPAPEFSGETWLYDLDCDLWTPVQATGPSPRSRHVGAFDTTRNRFVIYGGRYRAGSSGAYELYSDTWAFELATSTWTELPTTGDRPPALSNAVAVYDAERDRLVVHGGNTSSSGASFVPQVKVWALQLGTNEWSVLHSGGAPAPVGRLFHAAALDRRRGRLVVFSGGDANAFLGPFLDDVWAFDLATLEWQRLNPTGTPPTNRIRAGMAEDPERDRLLVFAGHDDQEMGEKNDLWALDLELNAWTPVRPGDTLHGRSQGFCQFPPDFTVPDEGSPERRDAHYFGYDPIGQRHVTFGGKTDCGLVQDVWTLDAAAGAWARVRASFTGESCTRSGKQNCSTLCF